MRNFRAIKAVSLIWLASLSGAGVAFLLQVVVARKLGVEIYGYFSSVLAVVAFLVPLAGFGLPQFWLKSFGQEGWGAIGWLRPSLCFFVTSIVVVSFLVMLWALIGGHSDSDRDIYFILIPFLLGNAVLELVSSKCQLEERYCVLSVLIVLPGIARLLMVLVLFFFVSDINYYYSIAFVYCFVGVFVSVLFFHELINMYLGRIMLVGHGVRQSLNKVPRTVEDVFWGAMPFGFAGSFHLIYFQSSIVMLAYLSGGEAAGTYNVAFLIMAAVYLFPNVVYQKFLLPKIHRWLKQDPNLFYKAYRVGSVVMFVIGCLASLAVWLVAPYVLPILFGSDFESAVEIVCLLSLCAPIRFMATSIGAALVTQEHMIYKVWCMAFVAVASLVLNFLLIPGFAIKGALLTTFISEILLLFLYYVVSKKYVFYKKEGSL